MEVPAWESHVHNFHRMPKTWLISEHSSKGTKNSLGAFLSLLSTTALLHNIVYLTVDTKMWVSTKK